MRLISFAVKHLTPPALAPPQSPGWYAPQEFDFQSNASRRCGLTQRRGEFDQE
jgi:hypothetical protein